MMLRKTKIFLSVSVIFFVSCVLGAGRFIYTVSVEKQNYIYNEQERLRASELEKSIRALTQTLNNTQAERDFLIEHILPVEEEGIITLLTRIGQIGDGQGVELETQSIKTEAISSTFEYINIHVTVTGQYEQVLHTLKLLEHLPYQVMLTNARITRDVVIPNDWTAVFELRFTKFVSS